MRQPAAGDAYVVGGYRDNDQNPEYPGLSMPFVPPASLVFLLGDVFDGHRQQDDPVSVPLLTQHAGGGLDHPPLWFVHRASAFDKACKAVWGRTEWAIVLLVPAGPAPDADASLVPEVVRLDNVPRDPHVAVTSLHEGGAVEQETIMAYKPHGSMMVWGAGFATALEVIRSLCGCHVHWRPHGVHRPNDVHSPELTASNAALLGRVVVNPHSDVAWLEPHRYCWMPVAAKVTSSDASAQEDGVTDVAVASHGSPTWTGAIRGTVPEAESIGAAAYLLHTPPSGLTVHVVDASIIGAQLRRAQEAVNRGIKGRTSHFINQHALNWVVEGLCRLPRRVGGPHHWVERQSSHLVAVLLEEPDFAAAHAKAPPLQLMLPKEPATLLVPNESGCSNLMCLPCGLSSRSERRSGTRWRRAQGSTRHWLVLVKLCPPERCIMALHIGTCCERETTVSPLCKSCDGGGRKSTAG